jgi:hypothetical protein
MFSNRDKKHIKGLRIEIFRKISPFPSLPKRGIFPPFGVFSLLEAGKGR